MARKIIMTILLLSVAFSSWAAEWFAYGGSFGTGIVLNDDSALRSYAENMHRVVLELDGTMEFIFHPSIRIAAGSILLTDFKFKDKQFYNSHFTFSKSIIVFFRGPKTSAHKNRGYNRPTRPRGPACILQSQDAMPPVVHFRTQRRSLCGAAHGKGYPGQTQGCIDSSGSNTQ